MSKLLINASQPEEIRVALLSAGDSPQTSDKSLKLWDLYIENTLKQLSLKNIYAGVVRSIEPGLAAAFIEYGPGRHGFLPFKEISDNYYKGHNGQPINTALKIGQTLMIQIKKEEIAKKGAALTTYITLPGSYLVLMPNTPGGGGISRRIGGVERKEMQSILAQLTIPEGMSLIVRTAGIGRPIEVLQTDLTLLLKQWEAIEQAFSPNAAPFLIFKEGDIIVRAIRDYWREDIDEILVDNPDVFEKTKTYAAQIRADLLPKLRQYQEKTPLFLKFNIEEEVESAFQNRVRLPSGGTIIFSRAEALTAIDINSGASTKHSDLEETALKTNLEAAEVIAKQLKLRDLGGLFVIDFIDMVEEAHKREVENKLKEATRPDRARIQIGRISFLGLLEMSRQRLRPSLGKTNESLCPHCQGNGTIRSIESLALTIIRAIEKQALHKTARQIRVELSLNLATYLINEKRLTITQLEKTHQTPILLLPNIYWETPRYIITAIGENELATTTDRIPSYSLLSDKPAEKTALPTDTAAEAASEVPAVQRVIPQKATHTIIRKSSLIKRLLNWIAQLRPRKDLSKALSQRTTHKHRGHTGNARRRPNSGRKNHRQARATSHRSNSTNTHTDHSALGNQGNRRNPSTAHNEHTPTTALAGRRKTDPKVVAESTPQHTHTPTPTDHPPSAVLIKKTTPQAKKDETADQSTFKEVKSLLVEAQLRNTTTRRFGGEPKLRERSYNLPKKSDLA